IVARQAVAVLPLAVAAPDDAVDLHLARQLDRHPALAALGGDPRAAVAVAAVVEVLQPVQRVVGEYRRGRWVGAGGGEGEVALAAGSVHLQLVDAGLAAVDRGQDGEADEAGLDGGEALDVAARIDAAPPRLRRRVGEGFVLLALLQLDEASADLVGL